MHYRISKAADRDFRKIYAHGIRTFGKARAAQYSNDMKAAFRHIADNPLLNRERIDVAPPVRVHVFHSHLILYRTEERGVLIGRILHGRENWQGGMGW
jgi:toxin ParE1/3/4